MSFTLTAMSLLLVSSLAFFLMKHPLSMGLMIMMHTLGVCILSGAANGLSWFSYILFLVFLGAIMVLFMYIASLAANELFHKKGLLLIALILPAPLIIMSDHLLVPTTAPKALTTSTLTPSYDLSNSIYAIYSPPFCTITLFVASYLLLTLLVIVELSSKFSGPVRSN